MLIAVIGHGRSPEGKGWCRKIDKCETVVRMWDWTWQDPADYGSRYTYGLFVMTPKGFRVFKESNDATPAVGWLAYNGKFTPGPLPHPLEVLDTERWHAEVMKKLSGAGVMGKFTLTRGSAAACWAIERAGTEPKSEVILVGFDNVKLGYHQSKEESFNPVYWDLYMSRFAPDREKVFPEYVSQTNTHDLRVEFDYLNLLAFRHGVKLTMAVDKWV